METPNSLAFCRDGQLRIAGVFSSALGAVPFSAAAQIEGEAPDGPLPEDGDLPEPVERAMQECRQAAMAQIQGDVVKLAAEDLVERARVGDQVAMGTIQLVGVEAQKGRPRAVKARRALATYIKRNPPRGFISGGSVAKQLAVQKLNAAIAGDEPEVIVVCLPLTGWTGVVCLANGPRLTEPTVRDLSWHLPNEDHQKAFTFGFEQSSGDFSELPADLAQSAKLGFDVAAAWKIQQVRLPGSRISAYDADTGWELGE